MAIDDNNKGITKIKGMIKECLDDDSDRLTTWEIEFLDSVWKQVSFSGKQVEIIERIWNKLF